MQSFDIYFAGKILPDHDPEQVREAVRKLFKASPELLDKLFSGEPMRIKKQVDMDKAVKYRVAFREAGALVEIHPSDAPPRNAETLAPAPPPKPMGLQLAPLGSLMGVAREIPALTLPDISELDFGDQDKPLDDTPEPPPAHIDTDELVLTAADSGSLEEFARISDPVEIPDISSMQVSESDAPLDDTPAPPPAQIDTDALSMGEAASGSLEEFARPVQAQPLPDISRMHLEEPPAAAPAPEQE